VQERSHSDQVVTEERLEALGPDLGRLSSLGSDYRPRAGLGEAGSSALWDRTSGEVPSSVILYASGQEDLSESIERHREVSPDKPPILVFGPHLDLALARDALRAGASGFVHAGMIPNQLLRVVAVAAKGELVAPRELLKRLV
jgi:DNA-binding NarL/FixJ family response regulator